jgi:hypothetical protein
VTRGGSHRVPGRLAGAAAIGGMAHGHDAIDYAIMMA